MSAPLVSIVLPVYNGGNYLREAIDSALAQTYANVEIIVIDDGSVDDTKVICLSYGKKIRYYPKENGGVASALNYGINKMKGEYFSWLSHDDVYYPEKIQVQIDALFNDEKKDGIVIGNFNFFCEERKTKSLFDIAAYCESSKITDGVYPSLFGVVHACTMLVHINNIRRAGNLDETLRTTQDCEWIFRLLQGQKSVFIREPLISVRLHGEQGKHHELSFEDEQAKTHIMLLNRMKDGRVDDVGRLFGNHRAYYYQMAAFYWRDKNRVAFNYAKLLFENCIESLEPSVSAVSLKSKLSILSDNNLNEVCIFCVGQCGRTLHYEFLARGFNVDYFSDNNPSLWGMRFQGVECVPPSEINKDSVLVIVALQDSNELEATLKQRGFSCVLSYSAVTNEINSVTPVCIPDLSLE